MKFKKIDKDLIFKCRWFSCEFFESTYGEKRPRVGMFFTGKHKYFYIFTRVLAFHWN